MINLPILIQLSAAIGIAAAVVFLAMRVTRFGAVGRMSESLGAIAYLFDGDRLIHATHPALDLLRTVPQKSSDIDQFLGVFAGRFPNLARQLTQIADLGVAQLRPNDGGNGTMELRYVDGMTRVTVFSDSAEPAQIVSDEIRTGTLKEELSTLRSIVDGSEQLMWRTGASGDIVWANAAYLRMTERVHGVSDQWPPKNLFDLVQDDAHADRQALLPEGESDLRWFELQSREAGMGRFYAAQDVSAAVRADDIQQDVMQTLARTFAGLALGVAVFDRKRQLIMFNPSLSDMTNLKVPELIARPQIETFLDMLRETRVLPEPRDYGKWRRQLSELEAEAMSGDYVETWPLADGRTFRVTGRPFPSGSIALFFEDISEGVAQNRQMTSALRLCQDALDGVDDAIAVFGPNGGQMLLSNTAFRKQWGDVTAHDGQSATLEQFCRRCRSSFGNDSGWDDLINSSYRSVGPRIEFSIADRDDRQFDVVARHLSDGSMSVTFQTGTYAGPAQQISRACG